MIALERGRRGPASPSGDDTGDNARSTGLVWRKVRRKTPWIADLPQTAAPAPGQFTQAYRNLIQQGATGILVISLSRELSATMQSAETGAKESGISVPVRFVDSRSASMGEGITVIAIAKMAATGASLDELEVAANNFASRTKVFGALDTLENLKKGGRISNTKAFLASALAIKPIIEVREGKLEEGGKERGQPRVQGAE